MAPSGRAGACEDLVILTGMLKMRKREGHVAEGT